MRLLPLLALLLTAACTAEPDPATVPLDEDTLATSAPEPEPIPVEIEDADSPQALFAQFQEAVQNENRDALLALMRFPIVTPNGEMDQDAFSGEFEGIFFDAAFAGPIVEADPADLTVGPDSTYRLEVVEELPPDSEFEPGSLMLMVGRDGDRYLLTGFDLAG